MTLVRDAQELLGRRQVPENALLAMAPAFLDAAGDLAIDLVSPDALRVREITASVRTCISSQGTDGLRGDISGIEALVDDTSRVICTRQLPLIDRVLLIAAIVQGVEEGLRELLSEGLAPLRARDGPSPSRPLADAPVRTAANRSPVIAGGSSARALLAAGAKPVIGQQAAVAAHSAPMIPDYPDP